MILGCVRDIAKGSARTRLESWHAGRIVVVDGRLDRVERRLWGYRASRARVWWDTRTKNSYKSRLRSPIDTKLRTDKANAETNLAQNECQLYYHHGWTSSNFLVLGYVRSSSAATLSTFYLAVLVLDEIARIKGSHAVVAEITNDHISDRLLARWGWERHCLQLPGRHFIKRFYGNYPPQPALWELCQDRSR